MAQPLAYHLSRPSAGTTIASFENGEGLKVLTDSCCVGVKVLNLPFLRPFGEITGAAKEFFGGLNLIDRAEQWFVRGFGGETAIFRTDGDIDLDQQRTVSVVSKIGFYFLSLGHILEAVKTWNIIDLGYVGSMFGKAMPFLMVLQPFSPFKLVKNGCMLLSTVFSIVKGGYLLWTLSRNGTADRVKQIANQVFAQGGAVDDDQEVGFNKDLKIRQIKVALATDVAKLATLVASTALIFFSATSPVLTIASKVIDIKTAESICMVAAQGMSVVKFLSKDAIFHKLARA